MLEMSGTNMRTIQIHGKGFPARKMGVPRNIAGFFHGESHRWMRTGGTSILGNLHIQGLGLMYRFGTYITQLYIGDI